MDSLATTLPFLAQLQTLYKSLCVVQGKLAVCFADCAEEYEGKLDKLKFDIAADLARLTSRMR